MRTRTDSDTDGELLASERRPGWSEIFSSKPSPSLVALCTTDPLMTTRVDNSR